MNLKDKKKALLSGIEFFESLLESSKLDLLNDLSVFNLQRRISLCVIYELELLDFIRNHKLRKDDFSSEFEKFERLREARKRLFNEYEEKTSRCLQVGFSNLMDAYVEELNEVEYDDTGFVLDSLMGTIDDVHYLVRFFKESGVDVSSSEHRIEELDALLKEKMERIVDNYPAEYLYDHTRPIDHSRWWKFMDRIVAEEKKRKTSLVSTSDEKSS